MESVTKKRARPPGISYALKSAILAGQSLTLWALLIALASRRGSWPVFADFLTALMALSFGAFFGLVTEWSTFVRGSRGALWGLDNSRIGLPVVLGVGLSAFAQVTGGDHLWYLFVTSVFASAYCLVEVGFGLARGFRSVPPGRDSGAAIHEAGQASPRDEA